MLDWYDELVYSFQPEETMETEPNPLSRPKIANSIVDVIGATPCVRLNRMAKKNNVVANIILKLESMEPCSSVKDRIAKSMIEEAEKRGDIKAGETILIEATSGNTGIGMSMVAAAKGYHCILVMPDAMSLERKVMLKALGSTLVLTPAEKGVNGALAKANEILANSNGKGVILGQFTNQDNPKVHREATGPEIWYQTNGKIDFFICGVGTGGTLTGTSQFLRSMNPDVKVVAVEPAESAVLSGNPRGPHGIHGIGAGFIPENCDTSLISEIAQIPSALALETARECAKKEGIFVGISSGAAIAAAIKVGSRPENAGKTIVAIIPSFGERYLSTALFADLTAEAKEQEVESVEFAMLNYGVN